MARRLAFGWAVIVMACAGQAFALGLGEITVNSALNQRLDADIELLQTQGMQQAEILAQLASAEDFKRVGIERFFFLTGLRFSVVVPGQGNAALHITSEAPITEPYLNFLVQVMWPNGRLLKEYTLLLDPPTYKDQAAPAVASPGRSDPGGGGAGRVERTPTRPDSQVSLRSAPRSTQPAAPSQPSQDRLSGDSYGVTDRDDTLWAIARRARPSPEISVQQNMLAIVALNPGAFIGGNINLLKAGYTLRLPTQADAEALSGSEAIGEVASQNEAWQAYRRGEPLVSALAQTSTAAPSNDGSALAGQVDATAASAPNAARAGVEGELRIVAGDSSDQGTGAGGGTPDLAAIEGQLVAAQEESDRISRDRDEAVARLGQVTGQAQQAQRQVEVRDQQIAQLQEQMRALQNQTPAPAQGAPAKADAGGLEGLLGSPIVLIGAAIVLVLLIVAGLMRSRSRKAADDDRPTPYSIPTRAAASAPLVAAAVSESADEAEEAAAPEEFDLADEGHDATHHEGAQTSDVIGEADIYIAYGRYPQAVSLLLGALEEDADRSDVRVKLLEVYAETKSESGFATQMQQLLERCNDNELLLEARELEAKLRDDTGATVVAAGAAPATDLDDFELDLDDGDAAAEIATAPESMDTQLTDTLATDTSAEGSDDLGGDLGIDFNPDDDAPARRSPASSLSLAEPASEADDTDVATLTDHDEFDLEDLEFEPAPRSEANSDVQPSEESDDAFDFLNDEDAATTKLDLARAYIDMGDEDGAREILSEVLQEGSGEQQQTANELLAKLG